MVGGVLGRECSSEREGIPNDEFFLRGIERNRLHQTRFHHHFALRCDTAAVRCFRANEGFTHFLRLNNSSVGERNRITAHEFPNHVAIGGILRHCSSSEGERFPNDEIFLRGIERNRLHQTRFHHHFALRCDTAAVSCFRTNEGFSHLLSRELFRCSSWFQDILRRDFPLQRSISCVLGQHLSRDLQRFSHNNRRGRRSECDLLHLHFLWSFGSFRRFCRFTLNELLSAIYFSALLHPPRANGHVAFCRLRKRGNNWSIIHLCCNLWSWRKWSIRSKFEVVVRGKPFKSNRRFHHLNTSIHQRIVAEVIILEIVVDGF